MESSLNVIVSEALKQMLARPKRLEYASAWVGHIPFAHWLVHEARPNIVVELGTHNGVSYSAFCEAALSNGLPTKLYAVDTWEGDKHATFYSSKVFSDLKAFHDQRYAAFSTMMRMTFDDALAHFADGSVDIIHVDGLHTYEAVKHDFETWLPKASERGVMLFHDTQMRHADFGVWKFWEEVRGRYPSFEFHHSCGLGVLCVGSQPPQALLELCTQAEPEMDTRIRSTFAFAGDRWQAEANIIKLQRVISLERIAAAKRVVKRIISPYTTLKAMVRNR